MSALVAGAVLWIHIVTAAFFVGGSLFVWLVLIPASFRLGVDEARRTEIVGTIARRFGRIISWDVLVLIASGIFNATWYLSSFRELFTSRRGGLLLVKVILVALLLVATLVHDLYFSRRIARLARDGKVQELQALRATSRVVSALGVLFMLGVLVMVVLMQRAE